MVYRSKAFYWCSNIRLSKNIPKSKFWYALRGLIGLTNPFSRDANPDLLGKKDIILEAEVLCQGVAIFVMHYEMHCENALFPSKIFLFNVGIE